jgi:hypothetical protein
MTPIGVARTVPLFSLGFDSLAPVTGGICQDARLAGFKYVGRYLHNLTSQEVNVIFANKLAIWPLTFAPTQEPLNANTGVRYGVQAVHQANALGVPADVFVTIDFEAPAVGSNGPAHISAYARTLVGAGYGAALYVGGPEPLNGAQLYSLSVTRYIRAGSLIPEPPCGWSLIQLSPLDQPMFGTRVDVSVSCEDFHGRSMMMWYGQ